MASLKTCLVTIELLNSIITHTQQSSSMHYDEVQTCTCMHVHYTHTCMYNVHVHTVYRFILEVKNLAYLEDSLENSKFFQNQSNFDWTMHNMVP